MKTATEEQTKRYLEFQKALEAAVGKMAPADLPLFKLGEPVKLTVKNRFGKFSKKPFIGDEQFKLSAAYMGKTGRLIVVFKPTFAVDFAQAELPLEEAEKLMTGFSDFVTRVCEGHVDDQVNEIRRNTQMTEAELERQVKYGENELWGAWS